MQLIQRAEAKSLYFENTTIHLWNYGVKCNVYWLQQKTWGDMQLIYKLTIYAN